MRQVLIAALALVLAGCGGSDGGGPGDVSAHDAAVAVRGEVDSVTKVEDLTEDTDPNGLLGRTNGYSAATVLYDSRSDGCSDGLGVDCGAVVEQWPDESAAQDRADYIQGILKDSPILGSEYDYVDGPLILRVSGSLSPSEADEYKAAFGG